MKKEKWLVVANSSLARVFKMENRHSLVEIAVLEHPESRLKNLDIVSDKPGRDFESAGVSRHGYEYGVTPKQHEFAVFAKELAEFLETARNNGEFEHLYIAAGPVLLGLLRQSLHPSTIKLINGETDKDITHLKPNEILAHLPFLL